MTKDVIVAPFKICLIGDSGTGKTSLFSRLANNKFNLKYEPTNGLELNTHHLLVNDKSINTIIWDIRNIFKKNVCTTCRNDISTFRPGFFFKKNIAGGEKYRPLADSLYHDTAGILLVYDITNDTTFKNIIGWLKNITQLANSKTIIKLIGNKSDLEHQRAVPLEKAQKLADDYGISFTETSALNDSHVTQSFQWTIQQICSVTNLTNDTSGFNFFSTCVFISDCMSKNIQVQKHLQELSTNDTKRPFHMVLIDLNEAAKGNIHCVEKPLDDPNLKYVAISYRWGEVQETLIDTGVGYTGRVTSFDLEHFYTLCAWMKQEIDLKNMDYVWVDAICVDQANFERRKATIHQMNKIFERASYILALPDFKAFFYFSDDEDEDEDEDEGEGEVIILSSPMKKCSDDNGIKGPTDTLRDTSKGLGGVIFQKYHNNKRFERHHQKTQLFVTVNEDDNQKYNTDIDSTNKQSPTNNPTSSTTAVVNEAIIGLPCDIEHNKCKEYEQPEAFNIVLVNIKLAAEKRHIYCVNRPINGETKYIAISYRWGELDEQMVPVTNDYYARITSFHLQDFFKLCQAMSNEPTLKYIDYVWVDAICVDQNNVEKQKATIYRMNDIYIHSTVIIAVPDLNAHHISTITTANNNAMDTIQNYRVYLYYLLVGTPEARQELIKMDDAWMDGLGVPPLDHHRRNLVTVTEQPDQQKIQSSNTFSSQSDIKKNKNHNRISRSSFMQQIMTLIDNPTSSSSKDIYTPTSSTTTNNNMQDTDQQLSYRMMMEFQRFEWKEELYQRKTDIIQSMKFLQSLMEDWSNRTWVISEYHIAKKKEGKKLKFWYNQLSCPELDGNSFFIFDFNKTSTSPQQDDHQHPFTNQIIDLTRQFEISMRHRLTKRTVLEMMLQTKASKAIDRFHAIIPLSLNYKHHIKNRNTIDNLGISDMLSVRLKLMEWLTTKDKLILLFSGRQAMPSTTPLLPTFATSFAHIKPGLGKLLTHSHYRCNFDVLDNDKSIRFVRTTGNGLEELWLSPHVYCTWKHSESRHFYNEMGGKTNKIWQMLGLDPDNDTLDAISIPLFADILSIAFWAKVAWDNTNQDLNRLLLSDMQLVGSWEKNIWILYSFGADFQDGQNSMINPNCVYPMDRLTNGFRIY